MEIQKKLYVGCGLTQAPEQFRNEVGDFKDSLRGNFEVFDFIGLDNGTAADVYTWDIDHCVATCDIFVGICDYPSIGLGWELATAVNLGKLVIGAAHKNSNVTRLVLGAAVLKPNFQFVLYDDLIADLRPRLTC